MFDAMAWADEHAVADWELELLQMQQGQPQTQTQPRRQPDEPMELSPDPFYLSSMHAPSSVAPPSSTMTQPTLTSSASCPSFTSFYDLDGDDLLRDIPDGEPLGDHAGLMGAMGFGATPVGVGPNMAMAAGGGYDYVLEFQQQHQNGTMRQFPHQSAMSSHDYMALLQQSRRPLHMSASFTSLSSMETEYRRRLATKRKKAVAERWNKAQRHKSFDSTNSSVTTAPSPATSMEFSAYSTTSTFESTTPETHFLNDRLPPRQPTESEMIGFSIDDFPTTFTSDASWPMPPPLSLASGASFDDFQAQQASTSTDMDQLLLSDQEKANVSSLLDAIRDFDSPLPPHQEEKASIPPVKRTSPTLSGRPRSASGPAHPRTGRSPHLRGIARTDSAKRREALAASQQVNDTAPVPSVRERIQLVLEKSPSPLVLSDEEKAYLAKAPQFSPEKASETAGSLWLLLHASRCFEPTCSIGGCDVMRRVIRHCRGCEAPLGRCRDPCNDAKAMLFHHGTCKQGFKPVDKETDEVVCSLCIKVQEIDKSHNAINSRPPLSPQLKPNVSPGHAPMHPLGMPALSPIGGPVLIAPQPAFSSPMLKPAPNSAGGSKHVPIQPNPLPTPSNPMGMIGTFPHFGVSLALYLEQTSPAFRAEVKSRVEKRVTNAAGLDLIQHMQKKTRLRSLEDLRSEARAVVLGEMERELHLHMQAVNWANVANSTSSEASTAVPPGAATPPGSSESGLPSYMLSIAAAGFAAFYAQQASLQAAMAGMPAFAVGAPPRPSLSRQSSTGSLTSLTSTKPLAPKRSASALSLTLPTSSISPTETVPAASDKTKEAPLSV